ncbi:MAG TPA: (d)CMP kinase [Syntrophales bacterium]|nr:(d)CMP kinase [Syntrophales bacterium]
MKKNFVVTIDGPAGAGKSTVSKALARELSAIYLDTGAIYRAFAFQVLAEGILPDDEEKLAELCSRIKIYLKNIDSTLHVFVNGKNVTQEIRSENIGLIASAVSAVPAVRERLLSVQRDAAGQGGLVADGRDMGTVVFPDARYKFFLDADQEERVRRRFKEIRAQGLDADCKKIALDLAVRDRQDTERSIAPLKPAHGAIVIDSTNMSVQEIVRKMISVIVADG